MVVAYSNAKRAMEAVALHQARELVERGIHLNIVYPGGASTSMTQSMTIRSVPWWMKPFWPVFRLMSREDGGRSAAKAAKSTIWAALTPDLKGVHSRYYDTKCREAELHTSVKDSSNQEAILQRVRDALASSPS